MAKLYFRYGAMNAGKTCHLLTVAKNYEVLGAKVLLLKPALDNRSGEFLVESRIGISRKADILVSATTRLDNLNQVACILVDEAQFLSKEFIDHLREITIVNHIPVICYGIRTTSNLELFEGSKRLFEIADEFEELKTICECCLQKKATINHRRGGHAIEKIDIGGSDKYKSICYECYLQNPIQD